MMYCLNCGVQISKDAYVCPKCGVKVKSNVNKNKKSTGLGFAIGSLFTWIIPIIGFPISIIGLIKASKAANNGDSNAILPLVFSIIGLILNIIFLLIFLPILISMIRVIIAVTNMQVYK